MKRRQPLVKLHANLFTSFILFETAIKIFHVTPVAGLPQSLNFGSVSYLNSVLE